MLMMAVKRRRPADDDGLLNAVEAAEFLNISESSLHEDEKAADLPQAIRIGKVRRADGTTRAKSTKWWKRDLLLFFECNGDMVEFKKRKKEQGN